MLILIKDADGRTSHLFCVFIEMNEIIKPFKCHNIVIPNPVWKGNGKIEYK